MGSKFANFRKKATKNGIFKTALYNKMAFPTPPKNGIFETLYIQKMHFRDPLYNKMLYSRPPIQIIAFSIPHKQQNRIFQTPLYNTFFRFDPHIQKLPKFDPPLQKMQ